MENTPPNKPDAEIFPFADPSIESKPTDIEAIPAESEADSDTDGGGVTHFAVEPFIAKGGGTTGRFLGLLIGALIIGATLDYAFSLISGLAIRFFLLFPLVFGSLYGLLVGILGHTIRARSGAGSTAVVTIALLCGMLSYGGFHFAYYLSGDDPDLKAGESFFESLDRRATKGYIIHGKRGSKTNLGYTGTWIYWLFEMGIVAGFTTFVARSRTCGPYCEVCDRWNRKRYFGPFRFDAVVGHKAFVAGEPTAMFVPSASDHKVKIVVYDCPTCPEDPLAIQYTGTIGSGKTMITHSAFMVYPHEALPAFEAIEMIAGQAKG